jgi:monoterpene epsilon-lactone hydrolase
MMLSIVKYAMRRFKKKANWRNIASVRYGFEQIGRKYDKPNKACRYESFQIERMKAEMIVPIHNPDTNRVLLYFHGGGYAAGSISIHRAQVSQMVMYSGIKALLIEYRLAPEHKYPAPIEDAVLAYDWLLANN